MNMKSNSNAMKVIFVSTFQVNIQRRWLKNQKLYINFNVLHVNLFYFITDTNGGQPT